VAEVRRKVKEVTTLGQRLESVCRKMSEQVQLIIEFVSSCRHSQNGDIQEIFQKLVISEEQLKDIKILVKEIETKLLLIEKNDLRVIETAEVHQRKEAVTTGMEEFGSNCVKDINQNEMVDLSGSLVNWIFDGGKSSIVDDNDLNIFVSSRLKKILKMGSEEHEIDSA